MVPGCILIATFSSLLKGPLVGFLFIYDKTRSNQPRTQLTNPLEVNLWLTITPVLYVTSHLATITPTQNIAHRLVAQSLGEQYKQRRLNR